MKKSIFIFAAMIFVSFIFYTVYKKQTSNNIYIIPTKEALKYLEQKILFYKNDKNASEILIGLYCEKGSFYEDDEKYSKAYECYQTAFSLAPKTNINKEKFAELYFELGEKTYPAENRYYAECIDLLKGIKSNTAANIILGIVITTFDEHSEKSLQLLQLTSKTLPDSNKNTIVLAELFQRFAYCYSAKKEWQKAVRYTQKCLELVKKNDKTEISISYALESYSFLDKVYKNQRNFKKRIKNAQDAVAFMKNKEDDLFFLNIAYDRLGKIYKLDKRYSDAEKSYRKIIKIIAENPKLRKKIEYLIQEIDAYCEIGDLCLYQKAKKRAIEAFDETSKLMTKKALSELPKRYAVKIFRNIGDGYFSLEKYHSAEKYYKKLLALLLAKKTKDHRIIAYVCYRIGNIAFCQKKWQKAQKYFEKSWGNIHDKESDIDSVIILSSKLLICYRVDKQFEKGLKFALIAYEKQKSKYGNNLKTGLYAAGVGSFYDQLGQKNKALKYLKIAHQLLKKYGENQPVLAEKVLLHIKKIKK